MRVSAATVRALQRMFAYGSPTSRLGAEGDSDAPRVVLVEADPDARAALRAALEAHGFLVCAEADSGAAAIRAAVRERPDICLLSSDGAGDGLRVVRAIARRLPEVAVVVLTDSADEADLFEALRAGVSGYLRKDVTGASLAASLKGVLAGEAALPRTLMARVLDEFRGRSRRERVRVGAARPAELTVREWDVLELMRAGLSTAEIASQLYIAPVTVRTHVRSVLNKLAVADRAEAVEQLAD